MIYELEPVKNTNKISIFYYFLDTVDKPRYDTEGVFLSTRAMPLWLDIITISHYLK
ncbi:MAG TPA: palindromic element RPE4 domain-containing protein [Rickettsia endosymbiont of Bembidion nr. Transversale]|nr:palindromic element RPE4 domain-containing protein [Rickettsia endosymbiont of Stiretrus anchorago]HJD66129.1 palindromic element RPE4 domain-containing protein [Rickettsia endosymbiont of Bembidion nr. Transversale]